MLPAIGLCSAGVWSCTCEHVGIQPSTGVAIIGGAEYYLPLSPPSPTLTHSPILFYAAAVAASFSGPVSKAALSTVARATPAQMFTVSLVMEDGSTETIEAAATPTSSTRPRRTASTSRAVPRGRVLDLRGQVTAGSIDQSTPFLDDDQMGSGLPHLRHLPDVGLHHRDPQGGGALLSASPRCLCPTKG